MEKQLRAKGQRGEKKTSSSMFTPENVFFPQNGTTICYLETLKNKGS